METTRESPQDSVPPVEGVAGGGTGYGWNDGGWHCFDDLRGKIDPMKVPSGELLHVWCMPSTANIGHQEMPRSLEPITLLAARNERESTQIAMRPKVSWDGPCIAGSVQVRCTDLCSTSGDRLVAGKSLTLRRVVPILGVPDALVPLDLPVTQINLLPGETSAIWVSVDVPIGQPPGQYEGDIFITAIKADASSSAKCMAKAEKHQIYRELQNCLDHVEQVNGKSMEEVVERAKSASTSLRRVLLSPPFTECFADNGPVDMMDEDANTSLSVQVKLHLTVWDFTIPVTPSLPAVFGIAETVIEDRYGVEHRSDGWYDALEQHFKWLLQYRISPFFCRWGDGMRVLAYTCPWPAEDPKSDEYYSDPRLAAYAVPFAPVFSSGDTAKDCSRKEIGILKTKAHWKKAYFYLWDEPLNLEQYNSIRDMSAELHSYAPDARVLTTYYSGPSDAPLAPTNFEAFVKVPKFLRPHTQIYCTSEWILGNREDLVKDILAEIHPENGETIKAYCEIVFKKDENGLEIFHIVLPAAMALAANPIAFLIDTTFIGHEWWTYVCLGPSDPHPNWHLGMHGTQHRAVMWRVWKEGGTGFLYWGANCYEKATVASAEIRFRRGLPPGDGVLFYPGEVFSTNQLVASVRLERILSGMQDIEYLNLYTTRYGRHGGLALLEKTGVYLGPERYTHEHMPVDIMRGEIFSACRS